MSKTSTRLSRSAWRLGTAMLATFALIAVAAPATAGPAVAAAAPAAVTTASDATAAFPPVTFTPTVSAAGFVHPGIGVSADSLLNARKQVQAGVEPWASYYDAMTATKYASRTLRSTNQGAQPDQPAVSAFNSAGVQSKLIEDAFGAFTQATLYAITGDPVYRENGMRIIRIWSHMDPDAYAYYADAHIHTGVPLQRLLAAAEIFRYSHSDAPYSAYDIAWHDSDTQNLTTNLIDPMTKTFLYTNWRYLNQHLYPLVGAMSGYIFTDNRARYDEGVEWYTVNSTTSQPQQNGALAAIFPLIDKSNPLNTYGYSFVQHQEMGRDEAHGWDDVNMLSVIARLLTVQGTTVDPTAGTVSTASDAVSPYLFLNHRLLDGANAYVGYMLGHDVPWIDTTGGAGVISEAYRGRLYDPIDELYTVYKYDLGMDVAKLAPYLATLQKQQDGPIFYWGTGQYNFWNSNPDYAPDYWLSLPAQVAGQSRPAATDATVHLAQRSVPIAGSSWVRTDDGTSYVRMKASKKGSTVAVRTLMYPSVSGYSPVGVLIRTNGTATLNVSKSVALAPYRTVPLPDTHGAWRYVTYDMDAAALPGSTAGANLAYYTVRGSSRVRVDLDRVDLDAKSNLSIPAFPQGAATTVIAVAGAPLTRSLAASDPAKGSLSYEAFGLPSGAAVDAASGELRWTPSADQEGNHTFTLAVSNGTVDTTLTVTLTVAASRTDAYQAALTGYDTAQQYVSDSLAAFEKVRAATRAAIGTADDATFLDQLVDLQQAVAALKLLSPKLVDDGSLDYRGLVTSSVSAAAVANLVDGDFNTTSGDLRAPFVLDFGAQFRVSADAIGLQARYNFANRSQGANVYGSNDDRTWTLLTSRETTDTSSENFAIETIPVRSEVRDATWRYLKVQVDDPGTPTDPAYPGISSFSELRIHGDRHEMADAITSVTLASSNAQPGTAVNGDTVTLKAVADEPLSQLSATIEGVNATVTKSADGLTWSATAVLPDDVDYGRNLVFALDYQTAAGRQGATVTQTTDGSSLALWNTHITQATVQKTWVDASTVPWPGKTGTTQDNGWRMFDGDVTTYTDATTANGWVSVTPTDGSTFTVGLVRMHPRSAYVSRSNGTVVQGSNDGGATWTTMVTFSGVTADQWYTFPLTKQAQFQRIRVVDDHGGNVNVAEVQLLSDNR